MEFISVTPFHLVPITRRTRIEDLTDSSEWIDGRSEATPALFPGGQEARKMILPEFPDGLQGRHGILSILVVLTNILFPFTSINGKAGFQPNADFTNVGFS